MYRIFNIAVDSNIPLPELPKITHSSDLISNITFRLTDLPLTSTKQPHWFHHWYMDDDKTEAAISVARINGQYLLRFVGHADFMLDLNAAMIQCYPSVDTPVETIRHLLVDQVIPRFLGQQGNLILHASAVELVDGSYIAFLGKSGWGKSTIASSFQQHGAQLLTDDGLLLNVNGGQLTVTPAYAGSRLWQDSADVVFPEYRDLPQVTHYSNKKRLIILNEKTSLQKIELQAIFLLNDPMEDTGLSSIKIEALKGIEKIMPTIRHTFLLDVKDIAAVTKQFDIASHLSQTKLAIYSLSYPRQYNQLAELRAAILAVVK